MFRAVQHFCHVIRVDCAGNALLSFVFFHWNSWIKENWCGVWKRIVKLKAMWAWERGDVLHVNVRVADPTSRRVVGYSHRIGIGPANQSYGREPPSCTSELTNLFSNGSVKPKTPLQLTTMTILPLESANPSSYPSWLARKDDHRAGTQSVALVGIHPQDGGPPPVKVKQSNDDFNNINFIKA